jgi:hypothetical protein
MEENTDIDSHLSNMHRIYRRLVDEFKCEITDEIEYLYCCSRSLRAILHLLEVMWLVKTMITSISVSGNSDL